MAIILFTGNAEIQTVFHARGAYDFILKPIQLRQSLAALPMPWKKAFKIEVRNYQKTWYSNG
jgi:FixJ family two-component response regulator